MVQSESFKYKAFISYSHSDKIDARRLHRKLDGYLPPKTLLDPTTDSKREKRSRWRIFLDDDELSAAGNLTERIREALAQSESLVVLCSPASAGSHYVNEEIRLFKQLRGSKQVFAVIVAGKRYAEKQEAFPQALKYAIDADGNMTYRQDEPIAAVLQKFDVHTVFMKIAAGMLGVAYGDLANREQARRLRRTLGQLELAEQ